VNTNLESSEVIQLIILFALLLLSAFFSSAETAMTTVNHLRVKSLVEEGDRSAVVLDKVIGNTGKMLTAVLIGNNIVNISASSLATVLATSIFGSSAIGYATGLLTIVVLIFAEITPKTIASIYAESLALKYAYVIYTFMTIMTPVIFIVGTLSAGILKIFRINPTKKTSSYTEREIRTIVDASHEDGIIENEEHQMINNVFDFGDAQAKDIMIPRIDMALASIELSYEELMGIFERDRYTRLPIYKESTDNIVGIINMKDILLYKQGTHFQITDYLREPFYTYEYKSISELLYEMKNSSANLSIVLDEYGATAGLITLEDILEEIVGEIRDEYDSDEDDLITLINDHEYIVDGSMKIDDVNDAIATDFSSEDYDSIGGIIIEKLDRLPNDGESVEIGDYTLTVIETIKNRINKVRITLKQSEDNNEAAKATDDE